MKSTGKYFGIALMAIALPFIGNAAQAQSDSAPAAPPSGHDNVMYERMGPGPMGFDAMGFVGFEAGLHGKNVTGVPFTANFSTQTTETLPDGNKIQRSTSGAIARDSQGRTRRDMTLPAIGSWTAEGNSAPQVSFINDPVAKTHYILDVATKTAREMHEHGRPHEGPPPSGAGTGKAAQFKAEATAESLGTQTINGVSAQGTRFTRTIPAGQMGNEEPIVIVTERWYSPDLQMVVMTKRTDPLMGETDFQLTNIAREEPAVSLFQVPSDYTVKQEQHRGSRPMNQLQAPQE